AASRHRADPVRPWTTGPASGAPPAVRRSELHGDASEVVATHQVEVRRVRVRVVRVVREEERRLLVADVVDADVEPRVPRFEVVAERDVVIDGRAEVEDEVVDRAVVAVIARAGGEDVLRGRRRAHAEATYV